MKHYILIVAILIGNVVYGQQRERRQDAPRGSQERMQHKHGKRHGHMMEALELTDDQKGQIEALKIPHMKQIKSFENEKDIKAAELKAAIQSDAPDQKAIDRLVVEVNNIRSEVFKLQVAHVMEVRKILDEEQKLKFDKGHSRLLEGRGFN